MDIDRTQPAEQQTKDHRSRVQSAIERTAVPDDSGPTTRPKYGGPIAVTQVENGPDHEGGTDVTAKERRQSAIDAIAGRMHLPAGTDLDIEVDVAREQVTFVLRDRDTGELVRRIPEAEAQTLFEQLREFHGVLIDRSL